MLMTNPQRILLVRLSANGDIVQTFDTLKRLRQRFPHAHIGWAVGETGAGLLKAVMPWLDAVHVLPNKAWSQNWWKALFKLGKVEASIQFVLDEIHAQHYDVAIDVQALNKSAVLPHLVGIPHRVGFKNGREQSRFFYTETPSELLGFYHPTHHAIEEFASLLSPWGQPPTDAQTTALPPLDWQFPIPHTPDFQSWHDAKDQKKRLIALAPFTIWQSKHWLATHWQTLITTLLREDANAVGVCIGSPQEVDKWQALVDGLPQDIKARLIRIEGKTSLLQLAQVLKEVDVLIGSDSAPLHMMDWLIREGLNPAGKAVCLLGPTHPHRTGGLSPRTVNLRHLLPCMPCHKKQCPLGTNACMAQLTPEVVLMHINF
jgi:heptosyltransferase-1